MNINIIVVVLIVVVIFLISQNMQKKEDFAWWDDARDWLKGAGKKVKSGWDTYVKPVYDQASLYASQFSSDFPRSCGVATLDKCASYPLYKNDCPKECATGTNSIAQCRDWAYRDSDECRANPNYMLPMCAQACNERDTNNKVM